MSESGNSTITGASYATPVNMSQTSLQDMCTTAQHFHVIRGQIRTLPELLISIPDLPYNRMLSASHGLENKKAVKNSVTANLFLMVPFFQESMTQYLRQEVRT